MLWPMVGIAKRDNLSVRSVIQQRSLSSPNFCPAKRCTF